MSQLRILKTDASVGGVDDFNSECTTSVLIDEEKTNNRLLDLTSWDGRGGIRGELDTNAALLLQPQIATNNQCRSCRVWYDEGWRVNVAFPAFHQREPITR